MFVCIPALSTAFINALVGFEVGIPELWSGDEAGGDAFEHSRGRPRVEFVCT